MGITRRIGIIFGLCVLVLGVQRSSAHPMGNFSINRYTAIHVQNDGLYIRYRIDLAEIPTFQELQASKTTIARLEAPEASRAYLDGHLAQWVGNLRVSVDGKPIAFEVISSTLLVRPGAGDLPTLLITIDGRILLAPAAGNQNVEYIDTNYAGRAGWQEIIVNPSVGCSIHNSTVPAQDASSELTAYPPTALQPPPQDDHASFGMTRSTAITTAPAAVFTSKPQATTAVTPRPRDAFAALITAEHVSVGVALISLMGAFVLGMFHALAPGHGKTVVAAYLVGSRGTARHAILLGIIVTLTHTAAVFALGLAVLFASKYVLPERLYPWLGFVSGMMILSIGAWQLVRRWSAPKTAPVDSHGHSHALPERITLSSLVALGVSGGIVPCPSALVVLLSAIALHRIPFGLVLIVAFSIGLAAVLIAIGWLMLYARSLIHRFDAAAGLFQRVPIFSSIAISAIGLVIAIQSLVAGGIIAL